MKDTLKVIAVTMVAMVSQTLDWLANRSNALTGLAALLACAYTARKFWLSFKKKRERKVNHGLHG